MLLECVLTFLFFTCGLCEYDETDAEYSNGPVQSELDPLVSLGLRYPFSQVKGFLGNPYSTHYSPVYQPMYPSAVPYYAAREYGLPGQEYVISDPYAPKYAPLHETTYQVTDGFSTPSESPTELPPEEEITETPAPTTTTPRPTLPTLPPPPSPPPPPPAPFHSTNAIVLAPPRVSHRPGHKLPPKPHPDSPRRVSKKKQKKKIKFDLGEWRIPYNEDTNFNTNYYNPRRVYIVEDEIPEDGYDHVNTDVVVNDPTSTRQHHHYQISAPFFPGT